MIDQSAKDAAIAELRGRGLTVELRAFVASVEAGDRELVKLFLDAGFDPAQKDGAGVSALVAAGRRRNAEIATLLLASVPNAAQLIEGVESKPHEARKDRWEVFQVLATSLAALAVPIAVALIGSLYSAAEKERETAGRLLNLSIEVLRADPRTQAAGLRRWALDTLIASSSQRIDVETQESLLKGPLSTTEGTLDALSALSRSDNAEDRMFAKSALGALFLESVLGGRFQVVLRLLERQVPVDTTDSLGTSALTFAVLGGQDEMVDTLLNAGANPALPNRAGDTALIIAARDNNPHAVARLLTKLPQDEVEHRNGAGDSALALAAREGNLECVKLLLRHGAKPTEGVKALARANGHIRVLRALQGEPDSDP